MPSQPRSSDSIASAHRKWLLCGWVFIVFLLVQRPLFSPDLWWHLARGREVVSGTLSPSRGLLTLDAAREADWLSGVPWYLAWTIGGNDALAVVPLASALISLLWSSSRLRMDLRCVIALPLMLVCIRDGLQPVPEWFDLLGMIVVWRGLETNMTVRQRCLVIFLAFAAWGNLGPRPIWGLLLLLFHQSKRPARNVTDRIVPGHDRTETTRHVLRHDERHRFVLFIIALAAGMLTPRGIGTWRDSALLFAPAAFADLSVYGDALWRGSFPAKGWDTSEWAFLLLWCGWSVQRLLYWRRNLFRHDISHPSEETEPKLITQSIVALCLPLLAALLCRNNLPICGLWIALDVLAHNHRDASLARVAWPTRKTVATAGGVFLLVALDAWGLGPGPCRRLGWGVSQSLNPGLLDQRLVTTSEKDVVGWAPDGRSVGIVTWLNGGVTMADHPQRALLGGRVAQHAALIHDFMGSHRARYRRDDGTWGGWVRQLEEWSIRQLFVPAEQLRLNRALLTTTWKPVDLDSPSIPFVSAYDPRFSQVVLESLQQRAFVEAGSWQPTAEIYTGGGWRFDFVELLGGGPDPAPAILQSQLFRSLDIPIASLRALLPVRQRTHHWELTAEFRACQHALAYQEWMTFGATSEWRRQVVHSWPADPAGLHDRPWLNLNPSEAADEVWKPAIDAYRKGRITAAIQALPNQSAQQHYAAGMLHLELGNSGAALTALQSLLDTSSEPGLTVAAKYWVEQLTPFVER